MAICLGGATFLGAEQFGNKHENDYILIYIYTVNDIKGTVELLLHRVLVLFESRLTAKDGQLLCKLF